MQPVSNKRKLSEFNPQDAVLSKKQKTGDPFLKRVDKDINFFTKSRSDVQKNLNKKVSKHTDLIQRTRYTCSRACQVKRVHELCQAFDPYKKNATKCIKSFTLLIADLIKIQKNHSLNNSITNCCVSLTKVIWKLLEFKNDKRLTSYFDGCLKFYSSQIDIKNIKLSDGLLIGDVFLSVDNLYKATLLFDRIIGSLEEDSEDYKKAIFFIHDLLIDYKPIYKSNNKINILFDFYFEKIDKLCDKYRIPSDDDTPPTPELTPQFDSQ